MRFNTQLLQTARRSTLTSMLRFAAIFAGLLLGSQLAHATASCRLVTDGLEHSAIAANTVLMLRATVSRQTGTTASDTMTSDCASLEATQAMASPLNLNVEIDDDATWAAKTQADFATYNAIVLGDPGCVGNPSPVTAAQSNVTVWSAAVTGPIAIIGTDPVFHFNDLFDVGAQHTTTAQLTQNAIAFASGVAGKTGAYISLSCYYANALANTTVPVLAQLNGGSTFQVQGTDKDTSTIADTGNALVNIPNVLSNAGLSNWGSSSHEGFNSFPTGTFKDVVDTQVSSTSSLPYILASTTSTPGQTTQGGPVAPGATATATFDNTAGQELVHTLKLPGTNTTANVCYQNGVTSPQLLSTNMIVHNPEGTQRYTFNTPWATGLLFEQEADDVKANSTGFGSLIADKCYQANTDPSTASFLSCPVVNPANAFSPSPSELIIVAEVFDFPPATITNPNPKPTIAKGTTVSLIHHPGQKYSPDTSIACDGSATLIATPDWVPVPSGATTNQVCMDVENPGTATYQCALEDGLLYDPAIQFVTNPPIWGVFGDQTGTSGGLRGRGVIGSFYNIPMLTTQVSVNGTGVNSPGLQDNTVHWFSGANLNLDFLVTPPNPIDQSNGWFAAPINNLAYVFYNNNSNEPLLPTPPNCSIPQPATSTCTVKSGTPGAFDTTTHKAAQVDFDDTILAPAEGAYTLAWSARDAVGIGERNIQLVQSGTCKNPNDGTIINAPCYTTDIFKANIGIDRTGPTITITTPANGAVYGVNQAVAANYSCSDTLSGFATCAGPVASGANIDTTPGAKSFKVSATDNAVPANASSATNNYSVAYNFTGFGSPVSDTQVNFDHAGRAIPLSWQVTDANGLGVDGITMPPVRFNITPAVCPATAVFDNQITVTATGQSGLQNTTGGYYQLNWQTSKGWAGSCVGIQVDPGDGIFRPASPVVFQFGK